MNTTAAPENATGRCGTFGGLFTPCMLTIRGVIMFLRFGDVVGQAGVWHATAIVAASEALTGGCGTGRIVWRDDSHDRRLGTQHHRGAIFASIGRSVDRSARHAGRLLAWPSK